MTGGSVATRDTLCYAASMVSYRWNHEKNLKLKQERDVSFEQAVMQIERGDLPDVIRHPDVETVPCQSEFPETSTIVGNP